METRENLGLTLFLKRRTLVRWVDIPGVCSDCLRSLEGKRYAADLLVNAPILVLLVPAIVLESKALLLLLGIYLLIILKWSWGLGYLWADDVLYGRALGDRLARFEPPGDAGTTRFPAGWWHCLVRFGALPALAVAGITALLTASLFVHRPASGKDGGAAQDRDQARTFLASAQDLAVPVDPRSLEMDRIGVLKADFSQFFAYTDPSKLPPGSSYQRMTGPQLLTKFRRSPGRPNDVLFIEGTVLKGISRREADALAAAVPEAEPPVTPPLSRP